MYCYLLSCSDWRLSLRLLDVGARLVEHQSGNEFVSGSGLSAHLALHRPDCFLSAHPDESDQTNRNSGPTKNMEDSTDCEIEHRLALQAYCKIYRL